MLEAKKNVNGIMIFSSDRMIERIKDQLPVVFTVSIDAIKMLSEKAIEKNHLTSRFFENMKGMFFPNSYIDLHINKKIGLFDKTVLLQIRKRSDSRGLNIFVNPNDREFPVTHSLKIANYFKPKNDYYNEVHLKTKLYNYDFVISIEPIQLDIIHFTKKSPCL